MNDDTNTHTLSPRISRNGDHQTHTNSVSNTQTCSESISRTHSHIHTLNHTVEYRKLRSELCTGLFESVTAKAGCIEVLIDFNSEPRNAPVRRSCWFWVPDKRKLPASRSKASRWRAIDSSKQSSATSVSGLLRWRQRDSSRYTDAIYMK